MRSWIDFLKEMDNLEGLEFNNCENINDWSVLKGLKVKEFGFVFWQSQDLSFLKDLVSLKN